MGAVTIHDGGRRAAAFKPFNVTNRANFWGLDGVPSYGGGWLRGHALRSWETDRGRVDYTVYSYRTPIAWHVRTGDTSWEWVIVDDRFSSSTNKHQNALYALPPGARHVGVPRTVQGLTTAQRQMIWRLHPDNIGRDGATMYAREEGQQGRTLRKLAAYGIVEPTPPGVESGWRLTAEIIERLSY